MKLKKKYPRGKRKKKSRAKVKLQSGKTMRAIKKMTERSKFGGRKWEE